MAPSHTVPNSVNYLKAAEVKVIAALGDSLTIAIGANGSMIAPIPFEFRDVSWSIGGFGTYQDVITLASYIAQVDIQLNGPAPKMTLHGHPTTINDTGFNFALESSKGLCSCLVLPEDNFTELNELIEINFEFQNEKNLPEHSSFHFTVRGHEQLAKGLWNNMFQPEGEKEMIKTFSEPIKLTCPPKV